jgi:hypothetical protein
MCCPAFVEAPSDLSPQFPIHVSSAMLFAVPGCWLDEAGLHFTLRFDGRPPETVVVAPGDAIAFGPDRAKVPRLGIVTSISDAALLSVRLFDRHTPHDARLVTLGNALCNISVASIFALVNVEFRGGPSDLPPLRCQLAADKFRFFCIGHTDGSSFTVQGLVFFVRCCFSNQNIGKQNVLRLR